MGWRRKKGELTLDTLIPWIIGVAVFVLMILIYMFLTGKLTNAGTFLQNLLRFGR